jgi:hypothetical protein
MAATSALEAELSSRTKEASKRWLSCGSERGAALPAAERHHPGSSTSSFINLWLRRRTDLLAVVLSKKFDVDVTK